MHPRRPSKAVNGAATRKKITFRKAKNSPGKETAKLISDLIDVIESQPSGSNVVDTKQDKNNELDCHPLLPTISTSTCTSTFSNDYSTQQIKVKRKSISACRGIKKMCITNLNSGNNEFCDDQPKPCDNKPCSTNIGSCNRSANLSDSIGNFWGDDHILADFNISEVVHSSLENSTIKNVKKNLISTPKINTNCSAISESDDQIFADFNISEVVQFSLENSTLKGVKDNLATCSTPKVKTNSSLKSELDETSKDNKTFYGLPLDVKGMFSQYRGIEELYDWQKDCLNLPAIKERRNLIYSLPTSGGKTLVSEILLLKELLLNKKDVLFILPFVSIVQEKVRNFTQFAVDLDFVIEEYAASKGKFPPRKRRKKKTLYIATIEKANGLVNSFIEESRIESLGLVIVDELHMIGEGGRRGAVLEMCLTKLLYTAGHVQMVGMSATLSNIKDLQQFLKAEVYTNDFRPVKLHEYIKVDNKIYEVIGGDITEQPVRCIPVSSNKKKTQKDPDNLVLLVTEVIPKYSCLVFCSTKRNCENVAKLLITFMPRNLCKIKADERKALLKALYNQANGLCPVLKCTVPYGVAYHHSGLTMDERKLIEDSYSKGVLCVLTCTSTLAAGVNLPAKRVIVRAPYVGSRVISRSQYKQMIGRAGRAGIDTSGESILILKESDKYKVGSIFSGPYDSCKSSLPYEDNKGIRLLILSLLGLKVCVTQSQLVSAVDSTLLAIQTDISSFSQDCTLSAIDALVALGHVQQTTKQDGDVAISVTNLGHATYKGCLDVDLSPSIYSNLQTALQGLVLGNELHLLYLVTPLDMSIPCELDWMVYQKQVALFSDKEKKAASTIGISEIYLLGKAYGQKLTKCHDEDAVRRFYMTLIMYKLVQGKSIWVVADLFKVPRGFVQNLLSSASSYATCLVHFTQELSEFWALKLLFEAIVKKLTYTASLELVPLMEISGVKQGRARQLFSAGYHTLCDVARASPKTLVEDIEHLFISQAKQIVSAAKMLLQEKADALREEAEELMS